MIILILSFENVHRYPTGGTLCAASGYRVLFKCRYMVMFAKLLCKIAKIIFF